MKKRIGPVILLVILTLAIFFVNWQLNNIKGVWYALKYNKTQIEDMITNTNENLKQDIETVLGHSIREFTEEEKKEIENGLSTEEEVIEKIVREESKNNSTAQNDNTVSRYVTELYKLKGRYIGILDGMVKSAVSEYKALDKSQRTRSKQLEIGANYVSKAVSLESECDQKVAAILSKVEAQLKKEGKSTDIIKTINNAYVSEKNLKRAYYLNMFK